MANRPIRIKTTVHGADQIIRALKKAGDLADSYIDEAVLAGAEPIRAEAERRAPKDTGAGAGSIEKVIERKSAGRVRAVIGPDVAKKSTNPRDRDHFYMLFQEFGADQHEIPLITMEGRRTKKGTVKKMLLIAPGVIRSSADHPGVRAQPFMRPAWDGKRDEADEAAVALLRRKLGL